MLVVLFYFNNYCCFFIDPVFLENLVAKEQINNNIKPEAEVEDSTSEDAVDKNKTGKMYISFYVINVYN